MKTKTETAIAAASAIIGDASRKPDDPEMVLALEFTRLLNEQARNEALRKALDGVRQWNDLHVALPTALVAEIRAALKD